MDSNNYEIITSYEEKVKTEGLKSLNLDEIEEYKSALQSRSKYLKGNINLGRCAAALSAATSGLSFSVLYEIISKYPQSSLPEGLYYFLVSTMAVGCIASGACLGASFLVTHSEKASKKEIDGDIELLDQQTHNIRK